MILFTTANLMHKSLKLNNKNINTLSLSLYGLNIFELLLYLCSGNSYCSVELISLCFKHVWKERNRFRIDSLCLMRKMRKWMLKIIVNVGTSFLAPHNCGMAYEGFSGRFDMSTLKKLAYLPLKRREHTCNSSGVTRVRGRSLPLSFFIIKKKKV